MGSAAAGGIAVGVPCGTIGFVAGGAIGFLPAIFTFGLSVPVFAVVGGGAGLCVGGTTGALGGGAAGYGAYAKRSEIRQGAPNAVGYVKKMIGRQKQPLRGTSSGAGSGTTCRFWDWTSRMPK